ncbi:hypothetical protein BN844_2060 [Pseudomonas sp. SHC52]|nr:hypothetical protein BN844_2060 [Pseudomonas sp. SHC52]
MGIEHSAVAQGQGVPGGQMDTADALATGVHLAVDQQAAVVQGHVDGRGPELVANHQIALLELETAGAEHLPVIQPLVQRRELRTEIAVATQTLSLDLHATGQIRHVGTAGVIFARAGAQDPSLQIDDSRRAAQGHGTEPTGLIVAGREVDARAIRLADAAVAALQDHLATGAVARDIVEGQRAAGHIDQRLIGQVQIIRRAEGHFAAGQYDRAGEVEARALEGQLAAKSRNGARLGGCSRHIEGSACRDAVDRSGFTGQQRGEDIQVAAAVGITRFCVIGPLALIHRQAALVVGGQAFAGTEVDVGEPQRQTIQGGDRARLGEVAVAELDALGLDVQATGTGAGPAGNHRTRRADSAVPDQVGRADARHVTGVTSAIEGRGAEHQVVQA